MGITRRLTGILTGIARWGMGLFVAVFAAVALWTYLWPDRTPPRADAIVCLGAGIIDPTRLDRLSRQRSLHCANLFHKGAAPLIAFTGTTSADGLPEVADLMADLARRHGVPASAILIEPDSRSTLQNALYTLPLLPEDAHIILVTDAFHLPRSWLSFKLVGAGPVSLSSSATGAPLKVLIRETAAIGFNLARLPVYALANMLQAPWAHHLLR